MKQLSVNLDELAFVLHRGKLLDMHCFLNASTGKILNIPSDREILQTMIKLPEDQQMYTTADLVSRLVPEGENYLTIPNLFQQNIFDLMSDFISSIQIVYPEAATQLSNAIQQEGGYKDFKKILRDDEKLLARYIRYRDKFFEAAALEWLSTHGIELV